MVVEILQTFSRIVLALLSGATIIFGTIFLADKLASSDVFQTVGAIINDENLKYVFLSSVAVCAYVLGVVNVAVSNLLFNAYARQAKDDLLIINLVESHKKPQLLRETMDVLNAKRTLISFLVPFTYFGVMLGWDEKQWDRKLVVRLVGVVIVASGFFGFWLAKRISRRLEATVELLSTSSSND